MQGVKGAIVDCGGVAFFCLSKNQKHKNSNARNGSNSVDNLIIHEVQLRQQAGIEHILNTALQGGSNEETSVIIHSARDRIRKPMSEHKAQLIRSALTQLAVLSVTIFLENERGAFVFDVTGNHMFVHFIWPIGHTA